jgi:hypothetical protein
MMLQRAVSVLIFADEITHQILRFSSNKAESRRLHEGTSRYRQRVCGLVPSPQVRPRRGQRGDQSL